MESTRLDQQTRNQLPDENYIEKLFPKCQPKSSSNRGAANQQFRNRRTMRPSDRQQQTRRQTRAKQQQQQQQQHQQQHQLEQPRHESGLRRAGGKSDGTLLLSNQNVRQQPSGNKLDDGRLQYQSSDSSDKEKNPTKLPSSVAMRRSNSSQNYPLSNGLQLEPSAAPARANTSNGRRSKKYKASKNLQQQLRRSQSSYGKLFNLQPPPVDPSIKESLSPNEREQSRENLDNGDQNGIGIQRPTTTSRRQNLRGDDSNSRGAEAMTSGQRAEQSNRSNRNNRGIVFAEPIATLNIELEPTLSTQPTAEADELRSSSTPAATSNGNEAKTTLAEGLHKHTLQTKVGKVVADDAAQAKIEVTGSESAADIHQSAEQQQYANTELPADDHRRNLHQKGGACETGAKIDSGENDERFINLFVYDNTTTTTTTAPQKTPESKFEQLDKSSLINFCQQQEDLATKNTANSGAVKRKSELKTTSTNRQLLVIEPDEENLVSNDTSTEELCSLADNEIELGTDKIRDQIPRPAPSKWPEDDKSVKEQGTGGASAQMTVVGKSILKHHHRSMGTLQTVDEKAETNIELEENNDSSAQAQQIPKKTQTESSENNMIKKSFQPPGFPQRIRSAQVGDQNHNENHQQLSPPPPPPPPPPLTTTTNNSQNLVPLADNCVPTEAQNSPFQERDSQEDSSRTDLSQCIQLDNTSIKNLSEALTKVHLEPNLTPRQIKLPNEASHFYAVRPAAQIMTTYPDTAQRHQSMQFNTLSDAESNPDDDHPVPSHQRHNSGTMKPQAQKRQSEFSSSVTRYVSPGSSSRVEDDSMPATRTALVFPRLDEGLSSEAESCDDEVDDDDDRAMEADVEADDDEDDEDDDDEDDDDDVDDNSNLTLGLDPNAIQTDSFQHHSVKQPNRHVTSIQMQSTSAGSQSRLPELNQLKFNDFNHQETLDQDDLKPVTSYANHNGQSNCWLGGTGQQSGAMSSQPVPFPRLQHGSNSGNNNNSNNSNNNSNHNNSANNNQPRSSSYTSREDASRLSSDTDNETDRLLGSQRNDQLQKVANSELMGEPQAANSFSAKQGNNSREVLIEGVLFNVKYLGSTHTEFEGRGEKEDRIHQAELAVHEVKFRNGETHSSVEVQLFISTEKIMVLDDKHRKIMMDHSLRTISYIADIGDAIVLIVRKKSTNIDSNNNNSNNTDLARPTSKTSCHVFESSESHTITKSISQAFQVAYTELLKANGGGDGNSYLPKELDYQEVLNSQEMSTTELEMFARKENQREVIVPKRRGEILGLSIVESGWGSVLPTAVIASLKQDGPAYRCKKLSVGDQILSINGISLVGLSLAECQKILRKTKYQSVARLSVVPCPITVEVKIKRPDTKYQLGFSVQHGVICSLLRGGIAERGGVRVGHRIISINGTTVVGVPHDKIVTLLASSVGEIRMKTCLTSLYRHMLGEEKNVSFV